MNEEIHTHNIKNLVFQRNAFLGLSTILSLSVLVSSCLLFYKQERIIVVPPVLETAFTIDGSHASPAYFEQMGVYFSGLLLNNNPQICEKNRTYALRNASPRFYSSLRERLIAEEKNLSEQKSSYSFNLRGIEVVEGDSSVLLEGDRSFYIGGKLVSSEKEKYLLRFVFQAGRLLIDSLEEISV
jgi:conjugal transfer pilus assembly protein TraE